MRNLKVLGLAVVAVLAMATAAQAANFQATEYPVSLTGEQHGEVDRFTVEGGALTTECSDAETKFDGTAKESVATLTIEATYKGCKSNLGSSVTIDMNGCDYTFKAPTGSGGMTYTGNVTIDCPAGKTIVVTGGVCNIDIGEQGPLSGITYTNKTLSETGGDPEDVTVDIAVKGIKYTMTPVFLCPFANETRTDGEYLSQVTIRGYKDGKEHTTANQIGVKVE